MQFLLGLPISRKTYVREKYLFGTMLAVVTWILSILMQMLFRRIQTSADHGFEFPGMFPVFLAIVFVFLGYSIPFILKYGAEKGRTISYATLFGVFAVILVLSKMNFFPVIENKITQVLEKGMIFLIVSIVFLTGSYFISLKIIEKKEY
ncbi:MAG: ABC-2 transporter permease [Lachnospiraceae bacterium]|nr:ABC-2 transporter permease [Lachnospiraceae bacterium]